jgi:hypothetical protein
MRNQRILLVVDALVNLFLGAALVLAPTGVIEFLGLPAVDNFFYTTVLGAVLVGIGLSLMFSLRSLSGLGLVGAIAINLCGATAVAGWLLLSPGIVSKRGALVLWTVTVVVYAIAIFELAAKPWGTGEGSG